MQNLIRNPVTIKELRSRMRGRRAFVVLTAYLALMGGIIMMVFLAYAAASSTTFGPSDRQAGKVVFTAVLGVQVILVIFIGPAFTSAAIVGEKERQTYDLLRTTLLSARSLVTGKLFSALSYVFLLIIVSIPLQSIAFLLGGISPIELFLSQSLIIIAAITFALIGLYFSSIMRSTLTASVTTFATALILTFGAPVLAGIIVSILGGLLFGSSTPNWVAQVFLIYGGLLLAATNLPATLVVSDIFLVEENTLFFFTDFIDGHTVYIFSPWILFSILYILLALLLYWACIRRVKRIAK
jgi:ABC-type transport system involved in multi-copper enzyme maturation permease subunit